MIQVIDKDGRMTEAAGKYAGLDRFEARKRVVEDLDALGLLERVEEHTLSIGKCQRSKTVIEPLVSKQWFVRTKPLAAKAIAAVDEKRIEIVPETWCEDMERMDAQHSRLVHFAAVVVGAIVFLSGIAIAAIAKRLHARTWLAVRSAGAPCIRTRMCSIRGLVPASGRSLHWAGRIRRKI